MQMPYLAAAVAVFIAADAPAQAADPGDQTYAAATPVACLEAARTTFRPEAEVLAIVEEVLRYRATRVGTDAGCWVVHASDRLGTPYEVRFLGRDLKMVSRHVVRELQ